MIIWGSWKAGGLDSAPACRKAGPRFNSWPGSLKGLFPKLKRWEWYRGPPHQYTKNSQRYTRTKNCKKRPFNQPLQPHKTVLEGCACALYQQRWRQRFSHFRDTLWLACYDGALTTHQNHIGNLLRGTSWALTIMYGIVYDPEAVKC